MKIPGLILVALLLAGCGTLHQHWGEIPADVDIEDYDDIDLETGRFSTIICAQGERRYYATGTSKPGLSLRFDDEGFQLFKSSYEVVRLNAGERDFTLKFEYKDLYATVKVRDFVFEPDTTYYARYSATKRAIKMWIEKENGDVVFGRRPTEGQF